MQFSAHILDEHVAPKLSKLTRCGAPKLARNKNYFSDYLKLSVFGAKFTKHLHALLVVYFRRVDFACVEYRAARRRLKSYTDKLPSSNTETRYFRLALSHFESSALHLSAAFRCGQTISKSFKEKVVEDAPTINLRRLANRVRHFEESVILEGKIQSGFGVSPIWITDKGLESDKDFLAFSEFHSLLLSALGKCEEFNEVLREATQVKRKSNRNL